MDNPGYVIDCDSEFGEWKKTIFMSCTVTSEIAESIMIWYPAIKSCEITINSCRKNNMVIHVI